MSEFTLNGVLEEEVGQYYHICFFLETQGLDRDNTDHYIFVPKTVCRIVDAYCVAVQDWYVHKKKLDKFMKQYSAKTIQRSATKPKPVTVPDMKKKQSESIIKKLGRKKTTST